LDVNCSLAAQDQNDMGSTARAN